jgi:hypothetical protein
MRSLVAALLVAGLAVPAAAQGMPGSDKRHRGIAEKSEQRKPKVDEKAYQSALDKLPDQKFDPWRTLRETPPPK